MSIEKTPLSEMEKSIVSVVSRATFPPATAAKRFIQRLARKEIVQLSPRGRWFLAFIAHRFRRQYTLSPAQWQWVEENGVPYEPDGPGRAAQPMIEFP